MRFDHEGVVTPAEVDALLDAARHAPSAGNSQPWAFIVGVRGDAVHERLVRRLVGSTARWAPWASLLVANLSHRLIEGSEMEYSEFAHYDLGQAVAHMTFQAHALGFAVHQFRAFDRGGIATDFHVPDHWEVTTLTAIGYSLDHTSDTTGSTSDRSRQSRDAVTWSRQHDQARTGGPTH